MINTSKKVYFYRFIDGSGAECSNRIKIPDFQRNFVWGNAQINKFIYSILDSDDKFYIGNFVVQQKERGPNLIIDGQQRIITLLFILISILHITEKDAIKEQIKNLLYLSSSSTKLRLVFSRKGMNELYREICKNKHDKLEIEDKILDIVAKRYKSINKTIKSLDYERLFYKIKKIELITINCDSTHNGIILYQGLNSTSKPLKPVELVKSLLIEDNSSNKKVWEEIERNFAKRNPIWFDKFLRHHWFSIGGYVNNNNLYDKIRKNLIEDDSYVDNLKDSAEIYLELRDAEFKKKGVVWKNMRAKAEIDYLLECLRTLRLDQVYAPLLSLLRPNINNKHYLENDSFYEDLYKIYSFVVLMKFSDSNPNKVETIFANFCKDISDKEITKQLFAKKKKEFYNKLAKIPKPKVFIKNVSNIKYCQKNKNTIGNKKLTDALLAIYLLSDSDNIIPGNCDIEHIFPVGDPKNWNITSNAKTELVENGARYLFGNLTLLSSGKDKGENLSFNNKYKKVYSKDRRFKKNKDLDTYDFNNKNPHKIIKARGEDMAEVIFDTLKNNII